MQLRYEQLSKQLARPPLAPIYLVSGEELLLVQLACDSIRSSAKKQGFFEREVFYAESGFDWQNLLVRSHNYGLFATKQMLELHLSQGISQAATEMLSAYAGNPPADKILLLITGKLERRLQQNVWFKNINTVGVIVSIWPMEKSQLTSWITERLATLHLKAETEAIQYLMSITEGNLLATAQEIEKLSLYFAADSNKVITWETMQQALADTARFDVFQLVDAALQGETQRCVRILNRLKEEGLEPLLILWSLSRECRQLASLALQLVQGKHLKTLLQSYHIWEKRHALLQCALQRHSLASWYKLLQCATRSDRIIKGVESGNVWQSLQQFSIAMAGTTS
jgi:DNA polymerase III subunit delta